jgi:uncharacterized membrane protein
VKIKIKNGPVPWNQEIPDMAQLAAVALLAQQTMPELNSLYWVMLLSRILHILGAIILVGGTFYLRAVIVPNVVSTDTDTDRQFGGRRAAWAMWVGIATLLLLVTGLANYMYIIKSHERLASSYHMIAGLKMLSGIALFLLAALIAGRTPAAETLRQRMRFWLNVALLLGIVTIALGGVLRTYPRTPKVNAPGPSVIVAPATNAPAIAPTGDVSR